MDAASIVSIVAPLFNRLERLAKSLRLRRPEDEVIGIMAVNARRRGQEGARRFTRDPQARRRS